MARSATFLSISCLALMLFGQSGVAAASPIDFDCDVPADHFSSVSQDASGPFAIKGTIELIQARSSDNLALAGVRIVSADGIDSTGFRIVAPSTHAKQLAVRLNIRRGDALNERTIYQVDSTTVIPFAFSLDQAGKVELSVADQSFTAAFKPVASGTIMAFCSTAQFKFKGLTLSGAEPPHAP